MGRGTGDTEAGQRRELSPFERAVALWVMARHNQYEETIVHRIVDIEQIGRAYFSAEEGWRYSEYTAEGPSVAIEYSYTDLTGKKQNRSIDIEGQEVGPFIAEIAALAAS